MYVFYNTWNHKKKKNTLVAKSFKKKSFSSSPKTPPWGAFESDVVLQWPSETLRFPTRRGKGEISEDFFVDGLGIQAKTLEKNVYIHPAVNVSHIFPAWVWRNPFQNFGQAFDQKDPGNWCELGRISSPINPKQPGALSFIAQLLRSETRLFISQLLGPSRDSVQPTAAVSACQQSHFPLVSRCCMTQGELVISVSTVWKNPRGAVSTVFFGAVSTTASSLQGKLTTVSTCFNSLQAIFINSRSANWWHPKRKQCINITQASDKVAISLFGFAMSMACKADWTNSQLEKNCNRTANWATKKTLTFHWILVGW